jgi:hypothetical protein
MSYDLGNKSDAWLRQEYNGGFHGTNDGYDLFLLSCQVPAVRRHGNAPFAPQN